MSNYLNSLTEFAAQMRGVIRDQSVAARDNHVTILGEARFNELALELFRLQFRLNDSYRRLCEARRVALESITDWRNIPTVATAAFKEYELTSLRAEDRMRVFHSSGTTEQRPSRHFHNADSLAVYEASLRAWFAANVVPENAAMDFLFLTPQPSEAPNSSLVHMFACVRDVFGSAESEFVGNAGNGEGWVVDFSRAVAKLQAAVNADRPLVVMGTAFNFIHLLDHLRETGIKFKLPAGSRVMETGGYKGRSRVVPKSELHRMIAEMLGNPKIICEYGMSELSSQGYDSGGQGFRFPAWARVQIISPETGREVVEGETGLICVFDLANVYSVMAMQTEDLGVRRADKFELVGRAALAEARGCSLQSRETSSVLHK